MALCLSKTGRGRCAVLGMCLWPLVDSMRSYAEQQATSRHSLQLNASALPLAKNKQLLLLNVLPCPNAPVAVCAARWRS